MFIKLGSMKLSPEFLWRKLKVLILVTFHPSPRNFAMTSPVHILIGHAHKLDLFSFGVTCHPLHFPGSGGWVSGAKVLLGISQRPAAINPCWVC